MTEEFALAPARGTRLQICRPALVVGLTAVALATAGCARSVDQTGVVGLGTAAVVISEQSQTVFVEGNRLVRRASVNRFVRSGDIALDEKKFDILVTPESSAAWQEVLSSIERYAALLGDLTDEKRGIATSDALADLAKELNGGVAATRISPGVGAAVSSLGGAIVDARTNRDARRILRTTDPAFQRTVRAMADAVGADDSSGLRGTIRTAWTAALDESRRPYLDAAGNRDEALQRRLVGEFLTSVDRRDAQLSALADLRASLLALGAAHAAAADGRAAPVGALLDAIAKRAAETKRLYDDIDHAKEG
jgi:hypothetical protein